MEPAEVEVWSRATNNIVLRLPERRFPGTLIQGDTLANLFTLAEKIRAALDSGDIDKARDDAAWLAEDLGARLAHYIATLDAAGERLPFTRPVIPDESDPARA